MIKSRTNSPRPGLPKTDAGIGITMRDDRKKNIIVLAC
jgi:hypothetical protein